MSTNVPINDASFAELRAFAETLGLEVKMPCNANQVRSKILAAFPDTTEVPAIAGQESQPTPSEPQTQTEAAPAPAPSPDGRPTVPLCRIRLQSVKDGPKNCNVSVNGKTWLINMDVDVDVPYFVERALREAKEIHYDLHQENPRDRPEMIERVSQAYPYSIVEPADKAEIAAWEAWSQDKFAPE